MSNIKPQHWVLATVSVVFILASLIYNFLDKNIDRSNWIKTVGTVHQRTYGRSGSRLFSYINGNETMYDVRGGKGFSGETIGDTYEILYNPEDAAEIFVLNDRPVFLYEEPIGETIGVLKDSYNSHENGKYHEAFPEFYYHIDGKEYSRVQKIKVIKKNSVALQKGMKFKVRYWLPNPQRSILDYDERR